MSRGISYRMRCSGLRRLASGRAIRALQQGAEIEWIFNLAGVLLMERELMIVRHAKSSWKDFSLRDFDRPLKGRGQRDAVKMGLYLKENGWLPDYALGSPARRAAQTLKRLMSAMDLDKKMIHWGPSLYLADEDIWLEHLQQVPADAKRVLIVGHNPGLEDLTLSLCREQIAIPEDGKLIPTATLVRLRVEGEWKDLAPGRCGLILIQRPRLLTFPP